MNICILNSVWKHCLEVSVGATPGGKGLRRCCEPLRLRGSAPFPGRERSIPGRAPLHAPRSASRASAAILSRGTPRADVWGGLGTVVVPRGVRRRSGLAAIFGVCYNRHIFKDPNDDDVSVLYTVIRIRTICTIITIRKQASDMSRHIQNSPSSLSMCRTAA